MASTTTNPGGITGSESIVAGYFSSGENAHRAIQALLDEGFLPSQIGAAFHSAARGGSSARSPQIDEGRADLETTSLEGTHGSGSAIGGPASDTTAVQPSGLAAGSGLPFAGIGREKPITGSELEHTGLPSELRHELPHEGEVTGAARTTSAAAAAPRREVVDTASPAPAHSAHTHANESWTDKLKHLFTPKHDAAHETAHTHTTATASTGPLGIDTQNFGTGEGSLGLSGRPYSPTAFATSATGAGVPAEHSHTLGKHLSRGGAVITVSQTGRIPEVERIFERFGGQVRFESASFAEEDAYSSDSRVEVFGHLEHFYPSER